MKMRTPPEVQVALPLPSLVARELLVARLQEIVLRLVDWPESNGPYHESIELLVVNWVNAGWSVSFLHRVRFEGVNPAFDPPWEMERRFVASFDEALSLKEVQELLP
jgi:hypothetical protein